jgi:carbon monoxide dehydrogenase subunit G
MVIEETTTIPGPPEQAVQTCTRALTRARFKNIQVNQAALIVTGEQRRMGQWTRSQVTLLLAAGENGTVVTVTAEAQAQSISSLIAHPAKRMAQSVLAELSGGRPGS